MVWDLGITCFVIGFIIGAFLMEIYFEYYVFDQD